VLDVRIKILRKQRLWQHFNGAFFVNQNAGRPDVLVKVISRAKVGK